MPTTTELGLQDFDKVGWMGFFLTAQTPPAVVRKLTDGLVAVLRDPEVARRYRELGGRPAACLRRSSPSWWTNDRKSWGALITSRQLQLD